MIPSYGTISIPLQSGGVTPPKTWFVLPQNDCTHFVKGGGKPRVLELGCGPGGNLWFFAKEGIDPYGIDGSSVAIETARHRMIDERPSIHEPDLSDKIITGDFTDLPFANEYFDAVIDNEAVYLNDRATSERIYQNAWRVLKPRGWLFVRTFAEGSWGFDPELVDGSTGMVKCTAGPLAGKGLTRFTGRKEIPELLRGFELSEIQLISRSFDGLSEQIDEWIIHAQKKPI